MSIQEFRTSAVQQCHREVPQRTLWTWTRRSRASPRPRSGRWRWRRWRSRLSRGPILCPIRRLGAPRRSRAILGSSRRAARRRVLWLAAGRRRSPRHPSGSRCRLYLRQDGLRGRFQRGLAGAADLAQHDMARVALQFFRCQHPGIHVSRCFQIFLPNRSNRGGAVADKDHYTGA